MTRTRFETGRPATSVSEKLVKESGSRLKGSEWVRINIAPVMRLAVASVTMKLLIRVHVISSALPNPSSVPAASANSTATWGGSPRNCMAHPAIIAVAPPMAPTARLRSPIDSATICAKPMVIWIAANRSSEKRLKSEVKPDAATEK